jgi:hypothetical protein
VTGALLLSLEETALRAGISLRTLRRRIEAGRLVADVTRLSRNGKGPTYLFREDRVEEVAALRPVRKPKVERKPPAPSSADAAAPGETFAPSFANKQLARRLELAPPSPAEMNIVVAAYENGTLDPSSPWFATGPPAHYYDPEQAALAA